MRDQPKPYFRIEDEQLQLRGTPVTLTQEEFVSANPPQIRSYLFRRVLFSGHFPKQIRSFLRSVPIGKDISKLKKIVIRVGIRIKRGIP
jgi:hypothetical protein